MSWGEGFQIVGCCMLFLTALWVLCVGLRHADNSQLEVMSDEEYQEWLGYYADWRNRGRD